MIEDYWLEQILVHHVQPLTTKLPRGTAQLFEGRVRDVYATERHKEHSIIYRPAIEDNEQNHQFRAAENRTVEALRDGLSTWVSNEPKDAEPYLQTLLRSDLEILRRIASGDAWHCWNLTWCGQLRGVSPRLCTHQHIESVHLRLESDTPWRNRGPLRGQQGFRLGDFTVRRGTGGETQAHQVEQMSAGHTPGDVITMSELSPLNRSLLGDGLREIAAVRRRVGNFGIPRV